MRNDIGSGSRNNTLESNIAIYIENTNISFHNWNIQPTNGGPVKSTAYLLRTVAV